jgi:hypothetical protein
MGCGVHAHISSPTTPVSNFAENFVARDARPVVESTVTPLSPTVPNGNSSGRLGIRNRGSRTHRCQTKPESVTHSNNASFRGRIFCAIS